MLLMVASFHIWKLGLAVFHTLQSPIVYYSRTSLIRNSWDQVSTLWGLENIRRLFYSFKLVLNGGFLYYVLSMRVY